MKILWGKSWGCIMFSQAMPSSIRFSELMRYLRFMNLLSIHHFGIVLYKMFKMYFFLSMYNIAVDEKLLPC